MQGDGSRFAVGAAFEFQFSVHDFQEEFVFRGSEGLDGGLICRLRHELLSIAPHLEDETRAKLIFAGEVIHFGGGKLDFRSERSRLDGFSEC